MAKVPEGLEQFPLRAADDCAMTAQVSVVIPAYEAPALVRAALNSVVAQEGVQVQIIVSDDSHGDEIAELVSEVAGAHPDLRWFRGPQTRVAADNWNHGLDQATAPLKVVLHQDEHYVDRWFLKRAADALADQAVAAAAGGVRVKGVTRPSRFALARPLGRLPGGLRLLPLINWLGPTGAVVFRGAHRFDRDFVQLADVEFYGRVLRGGALARLPGTSVVSLGHHPDSITASIDAHGLAVAELARLARMAPPRISSLEQTAFVAALRLRAALRRLEPDAFSRNR